MKEYRQPEIEIEWFDDVLLTTGYDILSQSGDGGNDDGGVEWFRPEFEDE